MSLSTTKERGKKKREVGHDEEKIQVVGRWKRQGGWMDGGRERGRGGRLQEMSAAEENPGRTRWKHTRIEGQMNVNQDWVGF